MSCWERKTTRKFLSESDGDFRRMSDRFATNSSILKQDHFCIVVIFQPDWENVKKMSQERNKCFPSADVTAVGVGRIRILCDSAQNVISLVFWCFSQDIAVGVFPDLQTKNATTKRRVKMCKITEILGPFPKLSLRYKMIKLHELSKHAPNVNKGIWIPGSEKSAPTCPTTILHCKPTSTVLFQRRGGGNSGRRSHKVKPSPPCTNKGAYQRRRRAN